MEENGGTRQEMRGESEGRSKAMEALEDPNEKMDTGGHGELLEGVRVWRRFVWSEGRKK